jgi:hypothetical protein
LDRGLQIRQRPIRSCAALLLLVALIAPGAAAAWTWPVQGPVLQSFLFDELTPKAPGQHRGISIGAPAGTPVLAPVDATITFAGTVPYGGRTLSLLTAQGLSVTLLHLGSFSVGRGASVAEGQQVGTVAPNGSSEISVPFVYLGVRRVEDPQGYLDPLLFLPPLAVQPPPVEPPAPDPEPVPVVPPAPVVPPPAVAPGLPVAQPQPPRIAIPRATAPVRPSSPARAPSAPVSPSPSPMPVGGAWSLDPASGDARSTTDVRERPIEAPARSPRPADPTVRAGLAQRPLAAEAPAPRWVRPFDPLAGPTSTSPELSRSSGLRRRAAALLAATLGGLALVLLLARRGRGGGARIIESDALLPDHPDLLCEREPSHRARVHDDRRGRARPAPQAAR